mmetsp:Transcript_9829/g.13849  ORF Transcript_9829/g.13849 Transcript_9829/m.13849 type:complete len:152 (-) Transcript_9829:286-741(-)
MFHGTVDTFLEKYDLQASSVPSFVIIHTALSAIWVSSTWYLCYMVSANGPSTHSVQTSSILPLPIRQKTQAVVSQLEVSAQNSKMFRKIQNKFNVDPGRFTLSYVESKIGRLFFKPITIPGRIWLSYRGSQAISHFQCRGQTNTKTSSKKN